MERGHPVRLSAQREPFSKRNFGGKLERAGPAGGQDVRAPCAPGTDLIAAFVVTSARHSSPKHFRRDVFIMRRSNIGLIQLVFTLLLTAAAVPAQPNSPMSSDIAFTVAMSKPYTHLLEVEIRVKIPANLQAPNESDLVMAVWTPGSYLVREFARHVQDFAADSDGHALDWTKVDKNTWRVKTNGARQWRATYRVYANELTVRTSELNSDHAFWNNATLLMYPKGYLNAPSTLRIVSPSGWKIATGLPPIEGQANTFRAENFDVLYDSPFEVSSFKELDFQVRGV